MLTTGQADETSVHCHYRLWRLFATIQNEASVHFAFDQLPSEICAEVNPTHLSNVSHRRIPSKSGDRRHHSNNSESLLVSLLKHEAMEEQRDLPTQPVRSTKRHRKFDETTAMNAEPFPVDVSPTDDDFTTKKRKGSKRAPVKSQVFDATRCFVTTTPSDRRWLTRE
jgi:hypothetical protein